VSTNTVQVIESHNKVEIQNETTTVVIPQIDYRLQVTTPGPQGPRGSIILRGSGLPTSSTGAVGDYYIDDSDGEAIYGPKTESGWPSTPFGRFSDVTRRNVFTQASPSSSWLITHDLGGYPSISVVDSAKTQVIGEVTYLSETQIRVDFTQPFSGTAYLT
jgi:hypothetical protein